MLKQRWIAPTEGQIKYLTGIANGSLNWSVGVDDIERLYGETHENGDPKFLALMMAEEHRKMMMETRAYLDGFIIVEDVEQAEPGIWHIFVLGTDYLSEIIKCLSRSVWWSKAEQGPDFEKTEMEWRGYLNRGMVTPEIFEAAAKNNDPELKGVRSDLVLFKLTAQYDGRYWRKQDAA